MDTAKIHPFEERGLGKALVILKSRPHPHPYFAEKGKTACDYYTFVIGSVKNMKAAIKDAGLS